MSLTPGNVANAVSTSATTISPGVPAGVADGDYLYAVVVVRLTGITIGAPAGWVAIATQRSQSSHTLRMFRKVAAGESGTYAFTSGGAAAHMAASVFAVRPTGTVFEQADSGVDATSDTTINVGAPGGGVADPGLLLACFGFNRGQSSATPNNGYTAKAEADTNLAGGVIAQWGYLASGGGVPGGMTWTSPNSSTSTWGHILVYEATATPRFSAQVIG